ncbi:SH3 domain-containing protein [Chloroflexales bacterium ZM16-3]|nr:SH3 domain-containing protein [Chloroflexales bacterium ZM16-3]
MPSNSEMYDRGALDAEHDDLNAFYYQHYYYYRKGYDDTRRQTRGGVAARIPPWLMPLLGALALVLASIAVGYWLLTPHSDAGEAVSAPTAAAGAIAPLATALPLPPTPTATSIPTPLPVMRLGGRARVVNVGDATLRARAAPGLASSTRVVARFPEGSEVMIVEGPVQVDGLTWWRISGEAGEGWSAQLAADGVVFLEPLP